MYVDPRDRRRPRHPPDLGEPVKKQLLEVASELHNRGKKTMDKEESQFMESEQFQRIGRLLMRLE